MWLCALSQHSNQCRETRLKENQKKIAIIKSLGTLHVSHMCIVPKKTPFMFA